jgi:tetratricopeptide (TPR) repeat protein
MAKFLEKNNEYVHIIDHWPAGFIMRKGKLGEIGIAEIHEAKTSQESSQTYAEMVNKYIIDGFVENTGNTNQSSFNSFNENGEKKIEEYLEMLNANPYNAEVYKIIGELYLNQNNLSKALEYTNIALSVDPMYPSALYNLSCVYARLKNKEKMLHILEKAIYWQEKMGLVYSRNDSYKNKARHDGDYSYYYEDLDFVRLCPPEMLPPNELKELYDSLKEDEVYKVVKIGEKLLDTDFAEKLAILEPMLQALKRINSDLAEHGSTNLSLYGGNKYSIQHYIDYENIIKKQIEDLKKDGNTSTIYNDVMVQKGKMTSEKGGGGKSIADILSLKNKKS